MLFPVSYLLMSLPSEGQSLSANQISSRYLNWRLWGIFSLCQMQSRCLLDGFLRQFGWREHKHKKVQHKTAKKMVSDCCLRQCRNNGDVVKIETEKSDGLKARNFSLVIQVCEPVCYSYVKGCVFTGNILTVVGRHTICTASQTNLQPVYIEMADSI